MVWYVSAIVNDSHLCHIESVPNEMWNIVTIIDLGMLGIIITLYNIYYKSDFILSHNIIHLV